jgi:hypothetical protein
MQLPAEEEANGRKITDRVWRNELPLALEVLLRLLGPYLRHADQTHLRSAEQYHKTEGVIVAVGGAARKTTPCRISAWPGNSAIDIIRKCINCSSVQHDDRGGNRRWPTMPECPK